MRHLIDKLKRALVAVSLFFACVGSAQATVHVVDIDGGIGPAIAQYVIRQIGVAETSGADLFVIRLNTPGGLDQAMRDMIQSILNSEVPVATFVTPSGARAASAGTYIAIASHIAAMSPATNIGSSTPVSIGGGEAGGPSPSDNPLQPTPNDTEQENSEPDAGTAMGRKVINDAVAYIKGLAELRERNVEWAEETVRDAVNVTAQEALELNVIDLIATDLDDLLSQINGQTVKNVAGGELVLDLTDAEVIEIEKNWRDTFLETITDPNIAYILMLVGVYAFFFELYGPGTGIGAVVGVICLLTAAYALQLLPVNYVALILVVVGVVLMVVEAGFPMMGLFALSGIVSFVLGSIMLFDDGFDGGFGVSLGLVGGMAALTAGFSIYTFTTVVRHRKRAAITGAEALTELKATVIRDFETTGKVRLSSEIWRAENVGGGTLTKDSKVDITEVDGLVLKVQKSG